MIYYLEPPRAIESTVRRSGVRSIFLPFFQELQAKLVCSSRCGVIDKLAVRERTASKREKMENKNLAAVLQED